LQGIGFGVANANKKIVQELSTSIVLKGIVGEATSSFFNATKNIATRLTTVGIRTSVDNTFAIDEPKLKRALKVNAEETLNIFTDKESGILPLLSQQLENVLQENLGDLDQKINQIKIQTKGLDLLAKKLNKFTEISSLSQTFKSLITVA
jgi:hypothetical protein